MRHRYDRSGQRPAEQRRGRRVPWPHAVRAARFAAGRRGCGCRCPCRHQGRAVAGRTEAAVRARQTPRRAEPGRIAGPAGGRAVGRRSAGDGASHSAGLRVRPPQSGWTTDRAPGCGLPDQCRSRRARQPRLRSSGDRGQGARGDRSGRCGNRSRSGARALGVARPSTISPS